MDNQTAYKLATPERCKKLMNLSRQVLEKVKTSGVTSGNQIAKEILNDLSENSYGAEFKNIQRRVYDALNVLHALNVISKFRNEISYQGFSNDKEEKIIRGTLDAKKSVIEEKRKALNENLMHYTALRKLLNRNMSQELKPNVQLPCVVIKGKEMKIDIQENNVIIVSKNPMAIYNDAHLMANMKFHHINNEELLENFPKELIDTINNEEEDVKEKDYRKLCIEMFRKGQCNN
ncbi:unnamed protein product [Blepharisma stoltei]|uniref:E2F/DP family winged-helix DNA-binding domain-containing protein n=1 Tax=Blepharisma stoltei TaxID=1481888 RepID=A0AAU9JE53_9CILI|nr:unnamed protein product [Blepharisma stoltei]